VEYSNLENQTYVTRITPMLLNFHVDKDELEGLISLLKKGTFENFSLFSKNPEIVHEMCNASRKVLKVLQENKPPLGIDFNDDYFEDGSISLSVALLNDEAAAMAELARKVTIIDAETFIKNKKNAKEAINGLWSIKEALRRWWINIDVPPDQKAIDR
jgi:hypothetical protein